MNSKSPSALIAIVCLVTFSRFAASFPLSQNKEGAQPSSKNQRIQVVSSIQDAEGLTEEDFSLDFLKLLEQYTVERLKVNLVKSLAANSQPTTAFDVTSAANYVEVGTKRLAVIRLRISDGSNHVLMNQVVIHGIVGKELKRVGCVHESS